MTLVDFMNPKMIYTGPFRFPNGDAAAHRVLSVGKIYRELGHEVIFAGWENANQAFSIKQEPHLHECFEYFSMNELDKPTNRGRIKKITDFLQLGSNTLSWLTEYVKENKVDQIIVYNPPFNFLMRLISFCKKNSIKLIGDCTEWYDSSHLPGGKYGLVSLDNYLRMHYGYVFIKHIIVISEFLKKYYDKRSCNTIKIPPLIDFTVATPKQSESESIEIIYAGSPGNKDNIKDIVGSMQKYEALKRINFNVVGISREQFTCKWPNVSFNNNIKFYGRVPFEVINDFYAKADFSIIIRPGLRYANAGFPTKFVESLSFGVPVITTRTSDLTDYLVNGKNGFLIASNNEESIADIFLKIASLSKDEIYKMKTEAAQTAPRFYYKNYINKLKAFTEKVGKYS